METETAIRTGAVCYLTVEKDRSTKGDALPSSVLAALCLFIILELLSITRLFTRESRSFDRDSTRGRQPLIR
jgi:hypothetical protein